MNPQHHIPPADLAGISEYFEQFPKLTDEQQGNLELGAKELKNDAEFQTDFLKAKFAEAMLGEGPECPVCGVVWTADGPEFYDESGFELECDCGAVLWVQPAISTSWTTRTVRKSEAL